VEHLEQITEQILAGQDEDVKALRQSFPKHRILLKGMRCSFPVPLCQFARVDSAMRCRYNVRVLPPLPILQVDYVVERRAS